MPRVITWQLTGDQPKDLRLTWQADPAARAALERKSFGRKYVEFATPASAVKLALYGRRALAKDAGVSPDGTGSHRLMIGSDAGPFTDPDGFAWEAA